MFGIEVRQTLTECYVIQAPWAYVLMYGKIITNEAIRKMLKTGLGFVNKIQK